jgi:flagellar hook-associated protein 2
VAERFGGTTTFNPAGGVTGDITLNKLGDATRAGTYAVNLTRAPATEQWEIALPVDLADLVGQSVVLGKGTTTVSLDIDEPMTAAQLVARLNTLAANAGLRISTSTGVGTLVLTASSAGAGGAFTADVTDAQDASTGAASRTTAGADVAGTIDGQAAKGTGSLLQRVSGTGGAVGLVLDVDVTQTGAVGTVTVATGLAQTMIAALESATDPDSGYLSVAQDGRAATAKDLERQFDAWTLRLEARKLALTRQFTAMETTLAALQKQAGFLAG